MSQALLAFAAPELDEPFFCQMLVLDDQPPQFLGGLAGQRFAYSGLQ